MSPIWDLNAISFTSASEGWAVGDDPQNGKGVLLHYTSSAGEWTSVAPPFVSPSWYLNAVHFTSENEGWAVGVDDSNQTNHKGILLHYSGETWISVSPPSVSSVGTF